LKKKHINLKSRGFYEVCKEYFLLKSKFCQRCSIEIRFHRYCVDCQTFLGCLLTCPSGSSGGQERFQKNVNLKKKTKLKVTTLVCKRGFFKNVKLKKYNLKVATVVGKRGFKKCEI